MQPLEKRYRSRANGQENKMKYIVTRWITGEFVMEFDIPVKAAYWMAAHSCGNVKNALYFLKYNGSYTASPFQVTRK